MMQYDYSATHDSWLRQAMAAKDKAKHLNEWRNHYEKIDSSLDFKQFGFTPDLADLDRLPHLSFMLRVPFKLRKPYLSKDDRTFHLLDNPVLKDKVFQTPMVASTSWKGGLRATFWQLKHQEQERFTDKAIERLFGNEREEEDHKKLKSGRLYFYPTFFDKLDKIDTPDKQGKIYKIGLEVINPHDRKTGTGKNPIPIESVPIGATGEFVLLYVPFGEVQESDVAKDLELVAEGVKEMLTVYGFGAKTSSGFGVAEQEATGQIKVNYPDVQQISSRPQEPKYPDNLRLFLEQNPDENFQLSPREWRKLHKASQQAESIYREARNSRSSYQQTFNAYEFDLAKWETEVNTPPSPQTAKHFNTLVELVTVAESLSQQLKGDESNA